MTDREAEIALDHIGVAVESLEDACEAYTALLGRRASAAEEVPREQVRVAFFALANCHVELLEGTAAESPVSRFIASGRRGVHHVAFSVRGISLAAYFAQLRDAGLPVLGDGPQPGARGQEVFFVHPGGASGLLVEFCQESGGSSTESNRVS